MAFSLALMPKTFSSMPSFKTYFQQPRKRNVVFCCTPERPGPSSGKGPKINNEQMNTLNSSQISVKDQRNEMIKKEAKELDVGSPKKAKASN